MRNNNSRKAVTPVVSMLLLITAIVLTSAVVYSTSISSIEAEESADAQMEYRYIDSNQVKITLVDKINADSIEVIKYNDTEFQNEEDTDTITEEGRFIIVDVRDVPSVRITAINENDLIVVENILLDD